MAFSLRNRCVFLLTNPYTPRSALTHGPSKFVTKAGNANALVFKSSMDSDIGRGNGYAGNGSTCGGLASRRQAARHREAVCTGCRDAVCLLWTWLVGLLGTRLVCSCGPGLWFRPEHRRSQNRHTFTKCVSLR